MYIKLLSTLNAVQNLRLLCLFILNLLFTSYYFDLIYFILKRVQLLR